MKANKKPTTITASVTVYATFDRSDVQDWFNAKVKERADDPTDLWSLMWRYDEFLSVVGDDDTLQTYLNNGGTFDDTDVDHEEYLTHCFDEFE